MLFHNAPSFSLKVEVKVKVKVKLSLSIKNDALEHLGLSEVHLAHSRNLKVRCK
jgi:hypothetical protein